jgi:hypothetical protein
MRYEQLRYRVALHLVSSFNADDFPGDNKLAVRKRVMPRDKSRGRASQ